MTNLSFSLTWTMPLALTLAFIPGATLERSQNAPQNPAEVVYTGLGPGMTNPKPIYQPNPEYADRPRRKKIDGNVLLSLIVTADGTVRDPQVTRSLDKDLDKKALECVSKWKFEPATKDGQPVAMHIAVEVNFRLY
jgi:TonB family protein